MQFDGSLRETTAHFDPTRHVAPHVAHELNNLLTVVQGYSERLLLRHHDDPALAPHLRLISEASKRAAAVVREATPPNANDVTSPIQDNTDIWLWGGLAVGMYARLKAQRTSLRQPSRL